MDKPKGRCLNKSYFSQNKCFSDFLLIQEGDECQLKNGNKGTCKSIVECPLAIADLKNGTYPQQCGFLGTQAVVCCPQVKGLDPKPLAAILKRPGDTANQKCVEYSKYVWAQERNPTLIIGGAITIRNECPFLVHKLNLDKNLASKREFPHMVQLGYDSSDGLRWACGGSLISDQYVLTAAHCLSDRSLGDVKYARMGIVNLGDDDHLLQFDIETIIPHPLYEQPSYYHDIGLVKLKGKPELNTYVRPACLPTNRSSSQSTAIASGWGKIGFAGPESEVLLSAVLELYDQSKCNETFKELYGSKKLREGINNDIMICAGHSKELKDTCQGDSGGPLHVYNVGEKELSCMYDIIGITSFGRACGIAVNVPAVYTRVSHYVKWIEDIVWPPT